jgi:hypothetical protein
VFSQGRNTESRLLITLYLRTNPLVMLREAFLGFHLWRKGRLSLKKESIAGRKDLRKMLNAVEHGKKEEPL